MQNVGGVYEYLDHGLARGPSGEVILAEVHGRSGDCGVWLS